MKRDLILMTIKKGRLVKVAEFLAVKENKLEDEINFWKWNMEKLGGWKVLKIDVKKNIGG